MSANSVEGEMRHNSSNRSSLSNSSLIAAAVVVTAVEVVVVVVVVAVSSVEVIWVARADMSHVERQTQTYIQNIDRRHARNSSPLYLVVCSGVRLQQLAIVS